ncbi:MAG: DUF1624 domain-containing protein [Ignavibacteriaceae bacterium]|nr:DUF1624 domain-containing protein [Ignavibacteriaceae bacterium]
MTLSSKKNRIIFIDLLRAFAVLQMVQGHTVDVLLANDYRDLNSIFFSIWFFMRGMTAPIFLFTSGTVFTYLFRLAKEPFFKNPRVKKGIFRFILLVSLGYLIRFPSFDIFDYSLVTPLQWSIFFAVDVLQLIGFGILFILIGAFISEKIGKKDNLVFSIAAIFFFALWPWVAQFPWSDYMPVPIAGYFYQKHGSLFPLFPWVGFLFCGAMLGSYLANNPAIFKTPQFSIKLGVWGMLLIFIFSVIKSVEISTENLTIKYWTESIGLIFLRVGFVLILNSLVSFISLKLSSIPKLFVLIGRNTLLIYVVHLIILYGSAWTPGLVILFDKKMGVWSTIGTAILMIVTMTILVIAIHKLKIRNKEIIT